ncbi:MAG: HlyD family type I secretion periplasmic adaptor subunit [Rhodospirillales bacterium]|nr:HlyD family type I secretion periplasmic adaptor subunit [Rhodospirillales bacterium]
MTHRELSADPSFPAKIGLAVLLLFVAVLGAWGALAPLSGAAIAGGNLQVEGKRQSVQHPYGGVVERLLVKEGDPVVKGQVLLTLSETEPRAQLDMLEAEDAAQKATEARLIAERDGHATPAFDAILREHRDSRAAIQATASEAAIMMARRRQYESEIGALRQKIAQFDEQIRGASARLDGAERQGALIAEELSGTRQLAASGYAPRTRVMALERSVAQFEADRGLAAADIAKARQAIGETEIEIAKADRARITEIAGDLRTVQSRIAQIGPRIDAARDVLARTRVTAPATGAVVGLTAFTEGGVVQSGARILDVVPKDNPLIVEARLRLSDVNEVNAGRPADVRLTSIPRSERPIIRGQVMTVSADRLTDDQSAQGYYSIQVRLDPEDVKKARIDLQSGMPAEVVMSTRARTLIDYLVGPLLDEMTGAFREK